MDSHLRIRLLNESKCERYWRRDQVTSWAKGLDMRRTSSLACQRGQMEARQDVCGGDIGGSNKSAILTPDLIGTAVFTFTQKPVPRSMPSSPVSFRSETPEPRAVTTRHAVNVRSIVSPPHSLPHIWRASLAIEMATGTSASLDKIVSSFSATTDHVRGLCPVDFANANLDALYREKHGICRSSSRRRHGHSGIIISRGRSLDPEHDRAGESGSASTVVVVRRSEAVPELQLLTRKINIADYCDANND